MPTYIYKCKSCQRENEIVHPISQCDDPSEDLLEMITCPYSQDCQISWAEMLGVKSPNDQDLIFERVPQPLQIQGSYGGRIPQGGEKRATIQSERAERSHKDFKKNIFPTIPKAEKKFFKEKWKKSGRE